MPLLLLFWLFWSVSLSDLARYPAVHFDEPVILSSGYKFFREGVYGSDLYTGFHEQERLYLEVPPTMSLILGFVTRLIGVGIWQMRYTAVSIGLLIMPLTYVVGQRLTGQKAVGLLAVFLLLLWRWAPGGDDLLGSGILLLDITRLARYDILVPVFGLLSFWAWLNRHHFRAGLLAGMAGFTNIYGIFWVPALGLLYLGDIFGFMRSTARGGKQLWRFLLGSFLPWFLWLIVLLTNWEAATGQFTRHNGRFDLLNPAFYWHNLITEINRYGLGFREIGSYGRVGFWLVVVGIPAGVLFLIHRIYKRQDRHALYLLVPLLTIPILMGLLVSLKRHFYLIILMPLVAILLAWLGNFLYQRRQRWLMVALTGLLLLFSVQGVLGIVQLKRIAQQIPSPFPFYADLASRVPSEGRIVASPVYWPIFVERDFRSMGLLFVGTEPGGKDTLDFNEMLEQTRPDIFLLDATFDEELAFSETYTGLPRVQPFWDFMDRHNARLTDKIATPHGGQIDIYQLEWRD